MNDVTQKFLKTFQDVHLYLDCPKIWLGADEDRLLFFIRQKYREGYEVRVFVNFVRKIILEQQRLHTAIGRIGSIVLWRHIAVLCLVLVGRYGIAVWQSGQILFGYELALAVGWIMGQKFVLGSLLPRPWMIHRDTPSAEAWRWFQSWFDAGAFALLVRGEEASWVRPLDDRQEVLKNWATNRCFADQQQWLLFQEWLPALELISLMFISSVLLLPIIHF